MNLKGKLKKTLIDLMAINEVYPNEDKVIKYTEKRLANHAISSTRDSFNNLIIKLEGSGDPVLLSTHFDIPEPAPNVKYIEEGDIIKSDGSSILGVDPKSGLAILIELLISLKENKDKKHSSLEVLLTRGEETGLHGAINADYNLIDSKIGLVLDEDGPVTQVVTRAPAFVEMNTEFIGKVVHPREPELGVNALQIAAKAIEATPCGYSTEGVTWNIGIFKSGTARNSVPGRASFKAEMRSFDEKLLLKEAKRIIKTHKDIAKKMGGKCKVNWQLEFGGYNLTKKHKLFKRLKKTFKEMNLKPNYFETFGGTDANIFNKHGIHCVPIGSGYYNAHQYTEYADLSDMEEIHEFLIKFLQN